MQLTVYGEPQPQGSKTAFVVKGRAVLTDGRRPDSRKKFASWREAVASAARAYLSEHPDYTPIDGPVSIAIDFYLPRPKSAPKKVTRPSTRPDLDKLTRSVCDSLTKLAYADDARIVELWVRKFFAPGAPHAQIIVKDVGDAA